MNNKLKIGQSFEVVNVLTSEVEVNVWQHCLSLGRIDDSPVYNNVFTNNNFYKTDGYGITTLLKDNEIKPIGKLTITKLK